MASFLLTRNVPKIVIKLKVIKKCGCRKMKLTVMNFLRIDLNVHLFLKIFTQLK